MSSTRQQNAHLQYKKSIPQLENSRTEERETLLEYHRFLTGSQVDILLPGAVILCSCKMLQCTESMIVYC